MVMIFPALRAALAESLIERYKISQTSAAQLLGVSQPAVSQYLRARRGVHKLFSSPVLETELNSVCERLAKGQSNIFAELCSLCRLLRAKRIVCKICEADSAMCTECDRSC